VDYHKVSEDQLTNALRLEPDSLSSLVLRPNSLTASWIRSHGTILPIVLSYWISHWTLSLSLLILAELSNRSSKYPPNIYQEPRGRRRLVWNEWVAQQEHLTQQGPPSIRAMRNHMQRWILSSEHRKNLLPGRRPAPRGPPEDCTTPTFQSTHTQCRTQHFTQLSIGEFLSAHHTNSQEGTQGTNILISTPPCNPTLEETHDGLPTVKLKATTGLC